MKKLLYIFSIFLFVIGTVATVHAVSFNSGCTSTTGYSSTTGQSCSVKVTYPAGCTSTKGYSSTTGQSCSSTVTYPLGCTASTKYSSVTGQLCTAPQVSVMYNPGCTSTLGYSNTTGQSCSLLAPSAPAIVYPAGCTSSIGFSSTTGQSCSGSSNVPVVTTPPSSTTTCYNCTPAINVAVPFSGQTYMAGQSVTVQWGAENIPVSGVSAYITLQQYDANGNPIVSTTLFHSSISGLQQTVSLPTSVSGNMFKISVHIVDSNNNVLASNFSNGYFTITASSTANLPAGCTPYINYSMTTGQPCNSSAASAVSTPVTTPTPTYLPGCTSTSGYSNVNGLACNGTQTAPGTPTSVPTPTPTPVTSTIPTSSVCNLTVSGVAYSLSPCNLTQSMVHGQGNQQATITITPSNSSANYGFSVRGNPAGFPTYGVMTDVSSGGASGATTIHVTFADSILSAGTYNGVLPIHIFTGSEAGNDSNYLALGINLTVTAPASSSSSSTQAGCNGTKYSTTNGALCTNY